MTFRNQEISHEILALWLSWKCSGHTGQSLDGNGCLELHTAPPWDGAWLLLSTASSSPSPPQFTSLVCTPAWFLQPSLGASGHFLHPLPTHRSIWLFSQASRIFPFFPSFLPPFSPSFLPSLPPFLFYDSCSTFSGLNSTSPGAHQSRADVESFFLLPAICEYENIISSFVLLAQCS